MTKALELANRKKLRARAFDIAAKITPELEAEVHRLTTEGHDSTNRGSMSKETRHVIRKSRSKNFLLAPLRYQSPYNQ